MTPYRRYAETSVAVDVESRSINVHVSDPSVARDNHIIRSVRDTNYKRCPVVLWCHDASEPPIGRTINLRNVAGYVDATIQFASADQYPFADTIFRLYRGGFLNAVSMSWSPIAGKWRYTTDRSRPGGIDFDEVDLLEISCVNVPSLTTALVDGRCADIDALPLAAWASRHLDSPGPVPIPRQELEVMYRAASGGRKVSMSKLARLPASPASPMFRSMGEALQSIARSCVADAQPDDRLQRAPSGAFVGDPTAGGFLVPTEYATDLLGFAFEESVVAQLCDRRATDRPLADVRIPAIDETSRSDGARFGGVASFWLAEGSTVTGSFPRFRQLAFEAKTLIAIVVVSNELLADAPMLGAHLQRVLSAEFAYQLDKVILTGSGMGVPKGVVGAPGTVSIAAEVGQVSGTILWENFRKMWGALPPNSRRRAVWCINQDVEEQLEAMANVVGTGGVPLPSVINMYAPRGAYGNEFPLLKGRPVHVVESAPAIGTAGDIVLGDFSHYILVDGGVKPALSTHVRFNNDEAVFRFSLRVDGQSAFAAPITSGGRQRSPFVTLPAR